MRHFVEVLTDPKESYCVGRNGRWNLLKILIFISSLGWSIDFVGKSGRILNAGCWGSDITVLRELRDKLNEANLGD